MAHTVIDDLRILIKDGYQLRGKEVGQHTDDLRHTAGAYKAKSHTFFHPIILFGSQILTHKGSQCLGKAGDRQESKAFNLGIGAAACHGGSADAVDIALHHNVGKTDHRILDTCRETKAKNINANTMSIC